MRNSSSSGPIGVYEGAEGHVTYMVGAGTVMVSDDEQMFIDVIGTVVKRRLLSQEKRTHPTAEHLYPRLYWCGEPCDKATVSECRQSRRLLGAEAHDGVNLGGGRQRSAVSPVNGFVTVRRSGEKLSDASRFLHIYIAGGKMSAAPTRKRGAAPMRTKEGQQPVSESMTLLTIKEVAEFLHYSVKTVYKKAARGEIPSMPVSRRKRLFSREAIHYWLANKQMGRL
jgi:excisionase family DNA binding protein